MTEHTDDLRLVYKHYRIPELPDLIDAEHRFVYEGTSLDKAALTTYLLHHYTRGKSKWEPAIYGGLTICYVYQGDNVVAIGEAQCSTKDQFCYHIGREIARGRALKELATTATGG